MCCYVVGAGQPAALAGQRQRRRTPPMVGHTHHQRRPARMPRPTRRPTGVCCRTGVANKPNSSPAAPPAFPARRRRPRRRSRARHPPPQARKRYRRHSRSPPNPRCPMPTPTRPPCRAITLANALKTSGIIGSHRQRHASAIGRATWRWRSRRDQDGRERVPVGG